MQARCSGEVLASQQSKDQMAPTLTLLSDLAKENNRIGVVGLPCQIWPIRKAFNISGTKKIAKKIVLTIGIFCAAQYYRKGTEHLIKEWGGIENIEDVVDLQYRGGDWPGSFVVRTRDGKHTSFPQHEYKYHHLIPYYQRDRCTMCLDYSADLADVSVGDIWTLSAPGELGWNAIIIRTDIGVKTVKRAEKEGYITTKSLDPNLILYGTVGLKSKLISNSYRFTNRIRFGWPVPDYGYEPTGYKKPLIGKRAIWSK
jgi:coenzyme F420 hydrogenase subunit beta